MDMRISGSFGVYNAYDPHKVQITRRMSRADEKRDSVSLSAQAKDFQSVMAALSSASDVRTSKISDLKIKVQNNTYFVKAEDIAEKIIRDAE